jgi:RNA polymerase sigma factor (TIGR02999 family)
MPSFRWLPEVYEELRRLATDRMLREVSGLTMQPTALVHEAWLKLSMHNDRKWNDREHFFRSAAMAMRRILVDHASRKRRRKQILDSQHEELRSKGQPIPEERLLLIEESLKKLEKQDPEMARVVLMKFYAGLTNREVAESLGVTERTVERQWSYARSILLTMIRREDFLLEEPS